MSKKVSLIIWLLISSYFIKFTIEESVWTHRKIIEHDVIFYYGYLPATFIYHDWTFRFPDKPGFTGTVWSLPLPNGNRVQKMTMGVAMLYAPFFGLAHLYTKVTGGLADGYSLNYQIALIWAGVFYFILGLFFLRKILGQFIDDFAVSLVLITIGLGTNLLNYASWDGAMSHVYSFFLFAVALWGFLKWLVKPKILLTIILGLFLGLIVLIWIPQLLYWKLNSGHFFVYSYLGENFFFLKPRIIEGLFSYHKGWLIYTPLMWLAIIGIFIMRDKLKEWTWPTIITMATAIYVVFSWWCWWYGGGYSARALVEYYVVMSFPLGAFYTYILKKKWIYKAITVIVLVFFIKLNLFQTQQYHTSLLHWDSMSKEAYWAIWNWQNWPENYEHLIVTPDADKAKKGESAFP